MSHIPPRLPKRGGDFVSHRLMPGPPPPTPTLLRVAQAAEMIAAGVLFAACMVALIWVFALMEAAST